MNGQQETGNDAQSDYQRYWNTDDDRARNWRDMGIPASADWSNTGGFPSLDSDATSISRVTYAVWAMVAIGLIVAAFAWMAGN